MDGNWQAIMSVIWKCNICILILQWGMGIYDGLLDINARLL